MKVCFQRLVIVYENLLQDNVQKSIIPGTRNCFYLGTVWNVFAYGDRYNVYSISCSFLKKIKDYKVTCLALANYS